MYAMASVVWRTEADARDGGGIQLDIRRCCSNFYIVISYSKNIPAQTTV